MENFSSHGRIGYGSTHRRCIDCYQVSDRPNNGFSRRQTQTGARVGSNHAEGLVRKTVASHDQKGRRFKRVTSSDQIKRILDVVRSCTYQGTGLA